MAGCVDWTELPQSCRRLLRPEPQWQLTGPRATSPYRPPAAARPSGIAALQATAPQLKPAGQPMRSPLPEQPLTQLAIIGRSGAVSWRLDWKRTRTDSSLSRGRAPSRCARVLRAIAAPAPRPGYSWTWNLHRARGWRHCPTDTRGQNAPRLGAGDPRCGWNRLLHVLCCGRPNRRAADSSSSGHLQWRRRAVKSTIDWIHPYILRSALVSGHRFSGVR